MAIDPAEAYAQTQASLSGLVGGLDAEGLASMVPATPDWSVHDVIAHLTGVAHDVATGEAAEIFGAGIVDRSSLPLVDAHTDQQVRQRRGTPVQDVLAEWARYVEDVLPMLRGDRPLPAPVPFVDRMFVTDLATHAQDVRGGLRTPGERDSLGVSVAFSTFAGGLHLRLSGSGIPALRIVYGEKERVLGDGEPAASVEADRFELYRAMAGRRSSRQILAYAWTGDPEPYLALIPAYGERADDLVEVGTAGGRRDAR
jgi:uncharacterized protein (TIGR03083 family)